MLYGVAIFPSKEVQDVANSYRKRFDPHYNLIQPHLTVREKEEWNDEQLAKAITHLQSVADQTAPFTVHFNRFSTFYPVGNVIYMALSQPEPLVKLYHNICSGLWKEPGKPYGYTPHLTIGQQLSSDELHDVLASLRKTPLDLTANIDRFHLLYQTENEAWTVHQTFQLKG
ncbi:2'-5' RNA ligase family protein [Paenibacillus hamazuiensis]|uniref:2'-5' RNA ligase family protein n=1 Tax=Paenibacillus hamazuiensis TaxID=2936508 RepID=UPI00200BE7F4|nr:2'-5' RNA ligase family protein [Paenibacillus hamazuiensis]